MNISMKQSRSSDPLHCPRISVATQIGHCSLKVILIKKSKYVYSGLSLSDSVSLRGGRSQVQDIRNRIE